MGEISKNKLGGRLMAIIGFLMLLVSAFAYIFNWDIKNTAFTVLGLVFVVIGLKLSKNIIK